MNSKVVVENSQSPLRFLAAFGVMAALLVAVAGLVAFVANPNSADQMIGSPELLSADAYLVRVEPLLQNANPANGAALIEQYECYACHIAGAPGIAPVLTGVGRIAAERRPPLTAAAYLYESILYPHVHLVEGYIDSMPRNFGERLSDQELGDLIAYLLQQ